MPNSRKHSFLLILKQPSPEGRRQAADRLRELGLTVVAQYGAVAVEATATGDQADAARELGLFDAVLKGAMAGEHLEKLSEDQRRIAEIWNSRFAAAYKELKRDRTHVGKSWDAEGMAPPVSPGIVDPRDFLAAIADWERQTGYRLSEDDDPAQRPKSPDAEQFKPMQPEEFVEFERSLAEHYRDPTVGYHLARIGFGLEPSWRRLLFKLPPELIAEFLKRFFAEPACWEMHGEISVGIVFVESSRRGGPRFSSSERDEICREIVDGLNWLTSQHPSGNLSWVYDLQRTSIDVANGSGDPNEDYWRDPAMAEVAFNGNSYTANWSSVAAYREDMRVANRSRHAMVIFATPYANSWHAYASSGRITLANKNNWGGWGRGTLDAITAHEACHLFGAADEYTGNGTPCSSCSTLHGCDQIPNGNCGACASPRQECVMDGNHRRLCNYTRGQIGWSTLFVEVRTGDELWAGTDDDVWLDIGDRTFVLDTPGHNDRERNNLEGYAIWAPEVRRSDIKRIMLRKSPDGFVGGWYLKRVRAWHQGQLICEANNIDRWLEDERRVWSGCVTDRDIVNTLRVKITTGDVLWGGTDDDVRVFLAGRSWNLDNSGHDDFERGRTDTFDLDPGTGLYRSAINSVEIRKSPDGFSGGWRLKGVEIIVNGTTIYNNQSINRWLEDNNRTWSATI